MVFNDEVSFQDIFMRQDNPSEFVFLTQDSNWRRIQAEINKASGSTLNKTDDIILARGRGWQNWLA
jgi:hypothetical protein